MQWAAKCYQIPLLYKVIDRINPKGGKKLPVTEEVIKILRKCFNLSNWTQYTIYIAIILAYTFSLRPCEYVQTTDYNPPTLNNITYEIDKYGKSALVYIIPKSKANQSGAPEIVKSACCCPNLCAHCEIYYYLKKRLKINKKIPRNNRKYLFLYNKSFIGKKNIKYNQLTPLNYDNYKSIFHKIFVKAFKKNHGYTPHGLRYGGITDLAALGLSECAIKGISRHAATSPILYRYIRFQPYQVANMIAKAKKRAH